MVIEKKKKCICFLLALGVLLSGMCFEDVQADFLFMEQIEADNTSKMEECTSRIVVPEVRTEQIVNRNAASDSLRSSGKTRPNIQGAVLCNCQSQNKWETVLWSFYPQEDSIIYSNTVTVKYIHKKDGKKDSVYMIG